MKNVVDFFLIFLFASLILASGCKKKSKAATLCYELILGGYTDWYLPSKDELNLLFLNKAAIGGFGNYEYWSSSEADANFASDKDFVNSAQNSTPKNNNFSVRAVRTF